MSQYGRDMEQRSRRVRMEPAVRRVPLCIRI